MTEAKNTAFVFTAIAFSLFLLVFFKDSEHFLTVPASIFSFLGGLGVGKPDGCPPLVDEDTFRAVQERLDAKKRAPSAGKAKAEYLLQGKACCGAGGARMIGESGRGRHGATYHYYTCGERKRAKKNEKKGVWEW
ncbi:MAG: zinc ribbon domain-containing protein [Lachnospiraceae bacterium]|jgi:hypothetical protein|nr:zinc ribbon domain-containing protein [Lachnospiraceae bacterium]